MGERYADIIAEDRKPAEQPQDLASDNLDFRSALAFRIALEKAEQERDQLGEQIHFREMELIRATSERDQLRAKLTEYEEHWPRACKQLDQLRAQVADLLATCKALRADVKLARAAIACVEKGQS
jgi:chromosome segregation ATPase